MKNLTLIFALFLLGLVSCKNEKAEKVVEEKVETVKLKYTLTPFTPSQSYDDAEINGVTYENGKFDFDVADGDYKLGMQTPDADQKMCANSGKGQHIHLIVGKEPYAAKYEAEFDYEIPDGRHEILAFLSRSYHESIKDEDARVAMTAVIENNTIKDSKAITEPALFYSRPKGTYVGKNDTEKVMLDFYVLNTELDDDTHVIATINGEEHILDSWQPYYIEGLPLGKNTINLKLVDEDGKLIAAQVNDITREFELQADPEDKM